MEEQVLTLRRRKYGWDSIPTFLWIREMILRWVGGTVTNRIRTTWLTCGKILRSWLPAYSLLLPSPTLFLDGSTHLYMRECPTDTVRPSVGPSVGPSDGNLLFSNAWNRKISHWGRPTLTLVKVLNVLDVLKVLNLLNMLNMPIGPIAQRPIAQRPITQWPIDTENNQS